MNTMMYTGHLVFVGATCPTWYETKPVLDSLEIDLANEPHFMTRVSLDIWNARNTTPLQAQIAKLPPMATDTGGAPAKLTSPWGELDQRDLVAWRNNGAKTAALQQLLQRTLAQNFYVQDDRELLSFLRLVVLPGDWFTTRNFGIWKMFEQINRLHAHLVDAGHLEVVYPDVCTVSDKGAITRIYPRAVAHYMQKWSTYPS